VSVGVVFLAITEFSFHGPVIAEFVCGYRRLGRESVVCGGGGAGCDRRDGCARGGKGASHLPSPHCCFCPSSIVAYLKQHRSATDSRSAKLAPVDYV
jgi:hypothetical protein